MELVEKSQSTFGDMMAQLGLTTAMKPKADYTLLAPVNAAFSGESDHQIVQVSLFLYAESCSSPLLQFGVNGNDHSFPLLTHLLISGKNRDIQRACGFTGSVQKLHIRLNTHWRIYRCFVSKKSRGLYVLIQYLWIFKVLLAQWILNHLLFSSWRNGQGSEVAQDYPAEPHTQE